MEEAATIKEALTLWETKKSLIEVHKMKGTKRDREEVDKFSSMERNSTQHEENGALCNTRSREGGSMDEQWKHARQQRRTS